MFISETYIKENTPAPLTLDPKDLTVHIVAAEKHYLRDTLGSEFYEYLSTKYDAQTLSANEETLVQDFIKPAVLYRALAFALPWIQYNLTSKGLLQHTDINSTNVDNSQFRFILNECQNRAYQNENDLKKYLSKNSNLFPQFQSQDGLTPANLEQKWNSGLIFY